MKSPRGGRDISKAWLTFMLTEYESAKNQAPVTVSITTHQVKTGAKAGEGYNAELVMLDVAAIIARKAEDTQTSTDSQVKKIEQETQREPEITAAMVPDNSREVARSYNLIIKFLPPDIWQQVYLTYDNYHLSEYLIYSRITQELNQFQASRAANNYRLEIPEFVFGRCSKDEYLVAMMNMKSLGYRICNKDKGLDCQHMIMAVDQLARLHAISYSFNQSTNFLENYPKFKFNKFTINMYNPFIATGYNNSLSLLKSLKCHDILYKKMVSKKYSLLNQFGSLLIDPTMSKFLCLNHGDFWNNNIMYQYEADDKDGDHPNSLKLIDWQMTKWNNPMLDLQYLFHLSTTRDIRTHHQEEILRHYHTVFTQATTDLGTSVPDYNFEQFKIEFEKYRVYGFCLALMLLQILLSKSGEKLNTPSFSTKPTPKVLVPVEYILNFIKRKLLKGVLVLSVQPSLKGVVIGLYKQALKSIKKELIAGKNEVLKTRVLELLLEADEKALFD